MFTAQQMKVTAGGGSHHKQNSPQKKISAGSKKGNLTKQYGEALVRDELLNRTHKFLGVVNSTLQKLQIEGLFYFSITKEGHL